MDRNPRFHSNIKKQILNQTCTRTSTVKEHQENESTKNKLRVFIKWFYGMWRNHVSMYVGLYNRSTNPHYFAKYGMIPARHHFIISIKWKIICDYQFWFNQSSTYRILNSFSFFHQHVHNINSCCFMIWLLLFSLLFSLLSFLYVITPLPLTAPL